MKVIISDLEDLILKTLRKKYNSEDAELIKNVILFGELSGKTSHGILRLIVSNSSIIAQNPSQKPSIVQKSKLSSLIESNGNPGMLVGPFAMREVIKIADEYGFGIVGTRKSFSTCGCISYYLEQIAKKNLIAIIMAQSPKSTVAYGGIEPLFGTNPISFGIPAFPKPLIFDMATSAISFGAILKAKTLNRQLPINVALDTQGHMTTDPNKAIDGATYAFDNSYKGSGLAMMVEILAGLWPNADFAGNNSEGGWGNIFMAFSPTLLMNNEDFIKKVKILVETVKNSKTKDGKKVRISGEQTINTRDKNLQIGSIDIEDNLYHELQKAAA